VSENVAAFRDARHAANDLRSGAGGKGPQNVHRSLASIVISSYDTVIEGEPMATVTISSKYQLVIPKEIREALELRPGQKLRIFTAGDRVELVPVKKLRAMRGFLRGIDTSVPREGDRV
jgi:AbrB family looped-hinge helix DNA binding protein